MDLQLKGKRVLITGSTRGIGRVMAEQFAAEGADVAICGRDPAGVERAAEEIRAAHKVKVSGGSVDVGDGEAIRAWVKAAAEDLGGLDIVVSNVSAGGGGRTAIEDWRRNFEVDMLGAVHTIEAALPFLEAAGGGSIVMISSTAGLETFRAPTPYNVMKAGLINYAKNLSQVLAPQGIRVNTVAPGPVKFAGGAWERIERDMNDLYASMLGQIPLGRMGYPEEVSSAVVYLSSPLAGYITGSNLVIDGGFTKRVNF